MTRLSSCSYDKQTHSFVLKDFFLYNGSGPSQLFEVLGGIDVVGRIGLFCRVFFFGKPTNCRQEYDLVFGLVELSFFLTAYSLFILWFTCISTQIYFII